MAGNLVSLQLNGISGSDEELLHNSARGLAAEQQLARFGTASLIVLTTRVAFEISMDGGCRQHDPLFQFAGNNSSITA